MKVSLYCSFVCQGPSVITVQGKETVKNLKKVARIWEQLNTQIVRHTKGCFLGATLASLTWILLNQKNAPSKWVNTAFICTAAFVFSAAFLMYRQGQISQSYAALQDKIQDRVLNPKIQEYIHSNKDGSNQKVDSHEKTPKEPSSSKKA
ncbi:MAG: hypothetical protein QRY71_03700 [Candidatus Rhabdochlamydia sp.]